MEGGAYGGAPAGSKINPLKIVTKPQVVLRLVSFVLCIIVIGCDAGTFEVNGRAQSYACLYLRVSSNSSSCDMTLVVAVIALLATIAFLVIDVLFDYMSNVKTRKILVLCDLIFSGLWTFLWFVSFCYLANSIRISNNDVFNIFSGGHAKATAAFVFFSIIAWAALTVHAVLRFRQGAESAFSQNYEPDPSVPPPAEATGEDSYQQPPFTQKTDLPETQHQAPTY